MKEPTVMSRCRRTTAILLLLILVLSMCVMPLSAREPDSKWDDWNISTLDEEGLVVGDDYDDDDFNLTGLAYGLFRSLIITFFLIMR